MYRYLYRLICKQRRCVCTFLHIYYVYAHVRLCVCTHLNGIETRITVAIDVTAPLSVTPHTPKRG